MGSFGVKTLKIKLGLTTLPNLRTIFNPTNNPFFPNCHKLLLLLFVRCDVTRSFSSLSLMPLTPLFFTCPSCPDFGVQLMALASSYACYMRLETSLSVLNRELRSNDRGSPTPARPSLPVRRASPFCLTALWGAGLGLTQRLLTRILSVSVWPSLYRTSIYTR